MDLEMRMTMDLGLVWACLFRLFWKESFKTESETHKEEADDKEEKANKE